jgi:hypothetical protein
MDMMEQTRVKCITEDETRGQGSDDRDRTALLPVLADLDGLDGARKARVGLTTMRNQSQRLWPRISNHGALQT